MAKDGGDYTTIQGAINSITDASIVKRYTVLIYPGIYSENVTGKNYVDLLGVGGQEHIIISSSTGPIYQAPQFGSEKDPKMQKCNLCLDRWTKGKKPVCVEACPTGVLTFGEYDELKDLIIEKKAEVLHPEYGTKPRVYYIGLPKTFVAGTVVFGDTDECAENVNVVLTGHGKTETARTNNYGDFEFEGIEKEKVVF